MDSVTDAQLTRQKAFWERSNHDRPVIGFTGTYFSGDTVKMLDRTTGRLRPEDVNVERILESSDAQYVAWHDCTGDLFWSAHALFAFRWIAAALGAPVMVGGDSIWAEPFLRSYDQVDQLVVHEDNPWVQKLWQLTDALVGHVDGRYPLSVNEFMAPLTALADFRGSTAFAFDLYDDPDGVLRAMDRLTQCWGYLVTAMYERLTPWHGGFTGAQRFIWAPGRIIEFNEDPAFMLRPEFHERFVIPFHKKTISYAPYAYIHLHSTQLHTLDRLLDLEELVAIELTPDYGQSIEQMLPQIAKAQARKPTIIHAFLSASEMKLIIDNIPPEGLCLISRANTPEDARRLQELTLG